MPVNPLGYPTREARLRRPAQGGAIVERALVSMGSNRAGLAQRASTKLIRRYSRRDSRFAPCTNLRTRKHGIGSKLQWDKVGFWERFGNPFLMFRRIKHSGSVGVAAKGNSHTLALRKGPNNLGNQFRVVQAVAQDEDPMGAS